MKTKAYLYLAAAIALGACQAPGGERMRLKGTLTDLPGDTLLVLSQPLTAQDDAGDAHLWQDTLDAALDCRPRPAVRQRFPCKSSSAERLPRGATSTTTRASVCWFFPARR